MLSCTFMAVSSLKSRRWTKDRWGWGLVGFFDFNKCMCCDYSDGGIVLQWGKYCGTWCLSCFPWSRLVYWQSSSSSFIHVPAPPDGRYSASIGWGLAQWVWGGPHIIRHQQNRVVRSAIKQNGLMRRWPCNHVRYGSRLQGHMRGFWDGIWGIRPISLEV